jgi:serine/threonine protein kinase
MHWFLDAVVVCRDACRNEVMLMQRLQHPNIVAYKDSFFANGRDNLCIVMTYCDGGDLGARVAEAKGTLIKEDQIMHWFVQVRARNVTRVE